MLSVSCFICGCDYLDVSDFRLTQIPQCKQCMSNTDSIIICSDTTPNTSSIIDECIYVLMCLCVLVCE